MIKHHLHAARMLGFALVALSLAALPSRGDAGGFKVLHSFCQQSSCFDGYGPYGGLLVDKSGNLYGTTYYGGYLATGVVFEVKAAGGEVVLHSFCGEAHCDDGAYPYFGVTMDNSGNLYGTTYYYGRFATGDEFEDGGTLFKITP